MKWRKGWTEKTWVLDVDAADPEKGGVWNWPAGQSYLVIEDYIMFRVHVL